MTRQLEMEVRDLKIAVGILATAIHELPRPLTHFEPTLTNVRQVAVLEDAVQMLRHIGTNGELHGVVEYYKHEVRKS
jgi:hypothetical protein